MREDASVNLLRKVACSMAPRRFFRKRAAWLAAMTTFLAVLLVIGSGFLHVRVEGSATAPPFDFSDQFYLQNGIKPGAILSRVGTFDSNGNPIRPGDWIFDNSNSDPSRRNVRLLQTTGGFDNSGSLIYYSIMGMVDPSTFTNDAAGVRAKQIANDFRAFIFPRTPRNADCSPGAVALSPAVSNRRQDNLFDTRDGYFSSDPLGLWILAFAVYTQKAYVQTSSGCQLVPEVAKIAAANGTDLDGTPILKTADGIDGLVADGFVEIRNRAQNGSQGFPWVI